MVIAMSRPWKHPKTHVLYFRKAVPEDLRAIVGKREEKVSLRTKDTALAKAAFAKKAAEVENRWKALRAKPPPLTHRQIVALAGLAYRNIVGSLADEPGPADIWEQVLRLENDARRIGQLDAWVGPTVDEVLQREGLRADDISRTRLLEEVDKAIVQAAQQLKRNAEGDYHPDPAADRFPEWAPPKTEQPARAIQPKAGKWAITGLLEDWWKEAKAAGKKTATYENYRNTIAKFVQFLGHDDAARVTDQDVIDFKEHRLTKVSARTVKDGDLSALKVVFGWGVMNRGLSPNPATGITIKVAKPVKLRSKGFTDAEAKALLSAAWNLQRGGEQPKTYAAKHWVPWLCAYTGARVGEIIQLRKEDLRNVEGVWVLTITPEAGTVKTNEARSVVLHTHLTELGFPQFVNASATGYLFLSANIGEDMRGKWRSIKNRVTEFVRTVVTDPNVAPNHGWRHRFKTVGMEAGIEARVLDAIQGHTPRTEGEGYGEATVKKQAMELAKLPRYEIDPR